MMHEYPDKLDGKALVAFEAYLAKHPMYGLSLEFSKKVDSVDPNNPEFLYKDVDNEWQMFVWGYETARKEFA
jgi:hypothetical protein